MSKFPHVVISCTLAMGKRRQEERRAEKDEKRRKKKDVDTAIDSVRSGGGNDKKEIGDANEVDRTRLDQVRSLHPNL